MNKVISNHNRGKVQKSDRKQRMIAPAAALWICLIPVHSAQAITNIENERLSPLTAGWALDLSLSGSGKSGNTDKSDLELGLKSRYLYQRISWLNIIEAAFGESEGERNEQSAFAHSRVVFQWQPYWALEGFVQYQEDEFTRLNRRALYGNGLRYSVWPEVEDRRWALGLTLMHEDERLDLGDRQGHVSAWRWSSYSALQWQLNDASSFMFTTYYQPLTSRSTDYRILADWRVQVGVTEKLSMAIGFHFTKDSQPPLGDIETIDRRYYTKLTFHF